MKLLIVEDDPRVAEYLEKSLRQENYSVTLCATISELDAVLKMDPWDIDLVVLDRMLGRQDGADWIKALKSKTPAPGILVLSSLDMPSEKARILDLGADDYMAKPFSLEELTARLRLVHRRQSANAVDDATIKRLANLVVNLRTQQAQVGKAKMDLTKKEFQLLSLLLEHPGRVFNRFQILDRVWQIENTTESNVVESTIKNLRKKMDEVHCFAKIESKRNVGYWIESSEPTN